jgi:hypothetical protein
MPEPFDPSVILEVSTRVGQTFARTRDLVSTWQCIPVHESGVAGATAGVGHWVATRECLAGREDLRFVPRETGEQVEGQALGFVLGRVARPSTSGLAGVRLFELLACEVSALLAIERTNAAQHEQALALLAIERAEFAARSAPRRGTLIMGSGTVGGDK